MYRLIRGEVQAEEWRKVQTEGWRDIDCSKDRHRLMRGVIQTEWREIQTEEWRDTD